MLPGYALAGTDVHVAPHARHRGCDGPGIAEDLLERVFEPYVRADSSRGADAGPRGTGLGLPIARNIIQSQGGTVILRRRPNRGLVAVVSLPR